MKAADDVKQELTAEYTARYGAPRSELVEGGRVRDYLQALDEEAPPAHGERTPALFLLTLGRTRRPMPASGGAVNAGDEIDFLEAVYVGDTITIQRTVLGVDERMGKNGRVFLIRAAITYTNQHGRVVARALQNTLRMGI